MRGLLIAFEGIDGSGLTTHSKLLVDRLKREGFKAVYTKEPTSGPIGLLIRDLIHSDQDLDNDIMTLLYAADRLWHLRRSTSLGPSVIKLLSEGFIVVSDRYKYSSMAYQGYYSGVDWVEAVNSKAPEADLIVYLDVPVDVAIARIESRPVKAFYETRDRLSGIKRILEEVIARAESRGVIVVKIAGVGARGEPRPIEEVHEEIYGRVLDYIRSL